MTCHEVYDNLRRPRPRRSFLAQRRTSLLLPGPAVGRGAREPPGERLPVDEPGRSGSARCGAFAFAVVAYAASPPKPLLSALPFLFFGLPSPLLSVCCGVRRIGSRGRRSFPGIPVCNAKQANERKNEPTNKQTAAFSFRRCFFVHFSWGVGCDVEAYSSSVRDLSRGRRRSMADRDRPTFPRR